MASSASAFGQITVRPNSHCTTISEPCDTLDTSLSELKSNTILVLTEGTHIIEELNIIQGVSNISIVGESGPSQVRITCANGTGLVFMDIFELVLSDFTIEGCGVKYRENDILNRSRSFIDIFYVAPPQLSAAIGLIGVADLQLQNVAVDGNIGFGLIAINLMGNSLISDTNFTSNAPKNCIIDLASVGGSGGGAVFLYHDFLDTSTGAPLQFGRIQFSELIILRSVIKHNFGCRVDLFTVLYTRLSRSISPSDQQDFNITGAGGISVILAQRSYHISVYFNSSVFQNNSASYNGAGLMAQLFETTDNCHVNIDDCYFLNNGGGLVNEYGTLAADPAGALLAGFYLRTPRQLDASIAAGFIVHEPSTVSVTNSVFHQNMAINGGALAVFSFGPAIGIIQDHLFVRNCSFTENRGLYGAVAFITELSYSGFEPGLSVFFEDIKVVNNSGQVTFASLLRTESGIFDISLLNVFFNGSNLFSGNDNTPVHVYSGIVSMTGTNIFEHNTGMTGGAMHFDTESYLILTGAADVTLQNNRGLIAGGAIYVNFQTIRPNRYDCFLYFEEYDPFCFIYRSCNISNYQATLRLINNSAPVGSAIYGSTLSSCPWGLGNLSVGGDPFRLISDESVDNTIKFLNGLAPLITFDPPVEQHEMIINTRPRVFLSAIGEPRCSNISVMPGQEFIASLGSFDELKQSVPVTVFSELSPLEGTNTEDAHSSIGETDRYLLTGTEQDAFNSVPVTAFGSKNQGFNVTILNEDCNVGFDITIYLTDCGAGFRFNNVTHGCECSINETFPDVQCMSNGTISYPVNAWIGVAPDGHFVLHNCIQDYCLAGITSLNLSRQDEQCNNNRHGILCGECKQGYSRVFGSTRCLKCTTNAYLVLIVVFAILGIVLVMTISFFNMTITDGYINGFIFYSNIVSVYLSDFLPLSQQKAVLIFVLIAFFNLDFGIETCFYTGMRQIDFVGLQFVFPLYLALLLLGITFIAKHCSKINIFRNFKVTHVFATLLLISYSKIVRTCIEVLGFTQLQSSEDVHTVWRSDPNLLYLTGIHIFLSILSIILLIVLIPIPFLLLFPTLIFKVPKLAKLKPLLDAFVAPFGTNRRFWLGFRLLFRLALFCIAYLGTEKAQLVIITVLLAVLMVVQAYLKPFSTPGRNVLDLSFVLNLTLLSIVSLYLRPKSLQPDSEEDVQYWAIGFTAIACAELLFLLGYYFIKAFSATYKIWKMVKGKVVEGWDSVRSQLLSMSEEHVHGRHSNSRRSTDTNELHSGTHSSVRLEATESGSGFETVDFIGFREVLVDHHPGANLDLSTSL